MVAFNQPTRIHSGQPRSNEWRSTGNRHWHVEERTYSRSDAFVMLKQATEPFVADDLLTFCEWIIDFRPLPGEQPVIQGLMRAHFVIRI